MILCENCEDYFSKYQCGKNQGAGECDCPKCQGMCSCRPWSFLTQDEIWEVYKQVDSMQYHKFARAIEARVREKNT